MHLADVQRNFWGGHAIVGAHLPLAAGMALADKYRGDDGRDAVLLRRRRHQHRLLPRSRSTCPRSGSCPCCGSARTTSTAWAPPSSGPRPSREIRQKAEGYGMPNARVDGHGRAGRSAQAAEKALAAVRGSGPFLLEVMTYRFRGHSMGDPERYRTERRSREVAGGRSDRHLPPPSDSRPRSPDGQGPRCAQEAEVEKRSQTAVALRRSQPDPAPEALFAGHLRRARCVDADGRSSPCARPSPRRCGRRWSATSASSSWAKRSACGAAPTPSPRASTTTSARSACATPPSPKA